jgi:hypothetical protein
MYTQKSLPKKEIIRRLKFILKTYKPEQREIDPRVVFDDNIWVAWDAGQFFSLRFKEMHEAPHNAFLFRKEIVKEVEKLKRQNISEKELRLIFEKKLLLVLTDFQPSGSKEDIASKMNEWYFKAFGSEVFTTKSGRIVPHKTSNHSIFEKANARYLYKKIINKEIKAPEIKILKLGNGKKALPHKVFLDEIQRLDQKNKTNIYSRIKYIITDYSEKLVNEVKEVLTKEAKEHLNVLQFKVLDALNFADYEKDIAAIECSYLFDTLSQPLLAKLEGNYYEVWTRGVIDEDMPIKTKKGKKLQPLKFRQLLLKNNYKELASIAPVSFNAVKIERKLIKIKIENYPYGKFIENFYKEDDNFFFSTNKTLIDALKNFKDVLVEGGYLQNFDYGFVDDKEKGKFSGRYQRYNGNITTPLNFELIRHIEPTVKLSLNHKTANQYASDVLNQRIISISNIVKLIDDFNDFKNLFPLQFHKYSSSIENFSDRLKQKYGYSNKGFDIFVKHLDKAGALNWKKNRWLEPHPKVKEYLFDYYLALFLHFKYKALIGARKLMWIFEKGKNEKFIKLLNEIGYKKEVLNNLFSLFNKIDEKSTLIYLEACKKDYRKKIDLRQDKINLDMFQDYFSGLVGGKKKK